MASMFWQVALDALETWLQADAAFAATVTHSRGDATVVDIAQGVTPGMEPPCARLMRGPQGEIEGTTFRGDLVDLPGQIVLHLDLHAPDVAERDDDLSAKAAWGVLAAIEVEAVRSIRAFFAPDRKLSAVLGAPFWCRISGPTPVDEAFHPAVASRLTLTLNRQG